MKNYYLSTAAKVCAVISLVATTGCAELNKRILDRTPSKGDAFTRSLATEYKKFAQAEQVGMYDDISAAWFYRKAITAAKGCAVEPENPADWRVPAEHKAEILAAYHRLISAIHNGARVSAPKITAYTQAHFDAWVEQQAEGWQYADIQAARTAFYRGIKKVEKHLGIWKKDKIFFRLSSSKLTKADKKVINHIAALAKSSEYGHHIHLIGRTDRLGKPKYNQKLSLHRAQAVKKALVKRGIPSNMITIEAAGETPGKKSNPKNRRTDVIFLVY